MIFAATLVLNAATMVAWLFPKRLIDLGFPSSPILWYTALGIVAALVGIVAIYIVESRIDGIGVARRAYVLACAAGVLGLVVLALAPNGLAGALGVLILTGTTTTIAGPVSTVWVNRRATSDVRATVHSFLSQSESVGEIGGGFVLAALANAHGMRVTLFTAAALVAMSGALVLWSRAGRKPSL